ncbi:MAG: hypothetical protein QOH72_3997 [Solirubrobacteraceae bacterium]|jgi:hypothetical protein|nr:hypothetical protein [Solirubrobacteraceae bacterium]
MSVRPKSLNQVVNGERYRSAVSYLIADDGSETFLFRALNSNYFVQREGDTDMIEVLSQQDAERLYGELPNRHQSVVAAFPKGHGGVGMDTPSAYDDEDEKERLGRDYGIAVDSAYSSFAGDPQTAKG